MKGALAMNSSISIHAPRTGSDKRCPNIYLVRVEISIHAPRTGSDQYTYDCLLRRYTFQSTLPARGATSGLFTSPVISSFQSTLPARGATSTRVGRKEKHKDFNPRSPHGERLDAYKQQVETEKFQSTLPARGATPGPL